MSSSSLTIGIVGLPNVGKSTLFTALTRKQVLAANYPFATIDPNVGVVEVPDDCLEQLAAKSHSKKIIHATVEFLDIAGLVRGASKGEGLGNKFLANIREVHAIAMVVRAFKDPNIIHVANRVDPHDDVEVIMTELAIADLESVTRKLDSLKSKLRAGTNRELEIEIALMEKLHTALSAGKAARTVEATEDEAPFLKAAQLLTTKPILFVINCDDDQIKDGSWNDGVEDLTPRLPVCAKLEAELTELAPDEAKAMLTDLGLKESGLDQLIRVGYDTLGLMTFLTTGEDETRAWTITKGTKAPQVAGVIHTDFEKAFIRAEVINWKDYLQYGEAGCRDRGLLRTEGKDYIMKEGDICNFKVGI
jgi:GTP-binding protein YchF